MAITGCQEPSLRAGAQGSRGRAAGDYAARSRCGGGDVREGIRKALAAPRQPGRFLAQVPMFNPQPHRFFPVMQIDVVWFPKEGPGGDQFSEKIFQGPLPRMTRDALDYIKRNFISETVIKHSGRAESTRVQNFPYDAIEEAIVNAVYHRGYDVRET